MKVLVYDVIVPDYMSFEEIRDMVRYSSDSPIVVHWEYGEEKQIEMRKLLPKGRVQSRREFFYTHLQPRWESFGCKITNIRDEKATTEDIKYFKEAGWRRFDSPLSKEELTTFLTNDEASR